MSGVSPQRGLSFGTYEVNTGTGELRKNGVHVKICGKPFQLLLALLEHPGDVVTRKQLQERLWPGQTYLEFENGLNNAISRLRQVLGEHSENSHFIETIPRHGYRFLPAVVQLSPSHRAATRRGRLFALAVTRIAAIVLGVFLHVDLAQSHHIHSLAVLPFYDLATGKQDDYFAAGMTDAVTTNLAELKVSKVVSETSVARFKNSQQTLPEIAQALGVDAVVEGAILKEGNRVRITVQLIQADTDWHIWATSYERKLTNIIALQAEVAHDIAQAIGLQLSAGGMRKASHLSARL